MRITRVRETSRHAVYAADGLATPTMSWRRAIPACGMGRSRRRSADPAHLDDFPGALRIPLGSTESPHGLTGMKKHAIRTRIDTAPQSGPFPSIKADRT